MDKLTETILREPADVYHAQAKNYLTSHQLADFRRSPLLYRKKKLGLIEDEDRPAYLVGRALHTLVIEGPQAFEEQYAVGGPINPKTGEIYGANTKAFTEWSAAQGKPTLTLQQQELIIRMAGAVHGHTIANNLLSDGIPEGVVRAEYCQVPCQIRMDWFDPRRGIVELKTCDDLDWFEADARRYGYVNQVAFYQGVLAEALGVHQQVYFVAVEKKEPFRCGVWLMHAQLLARIRSENQAAIEQLKRYMALDVWPTGYEELRIFDYA